jgi:MYXO-CTERM domain-containing protein
VFFRFSGHVARAAMVGAGVIAVSSSAQASYNGLSVELHTSVTIDGTARSVYRVYANFTHADDALHAVYGSPTVGALTVQSLNADGSGPGSNFFNLPLGGNTPPSLEEIGINPNVEWDTFATIGVSIADQAPYGDQLILSPSFPTIAGFNYTSTNAAWLLAPTIDHDNDADTPAIASPQSLAGFAGDNDLLPRVLLAQLTVNAGDNVAGMMNLVVFESDGAGGGTSVILEQQSFTSVPAPAALALLGLAGLRSRRRR